jgi:hypothetical protein
MQTKIYFSISSQNTSNPQTILFADLITHKRNSITIQHQNSCNYITKQGIPPWTRHKLRPRENWYQIASQLRHIPPQTLFPSSTTPTPNSQHPRGPFHRHTIHTVYWNYLLPQISSKSNITSNPRSKHTRIPCQQTMHYTRPPRKTKMAEHRMSTKYYQP